MKVFEKIKDSYSAEAIILAAVSLLAGLTIGFVISPVKNGITIGSYNGCNNRVIDSNKVNKEKGKSYK
ncbi:MAG: hypothetical protein K2H01_11830 [Ruminococcus sp.]|nr:hypothetical protein [Ruminococcus sp.]